MMVFSQTWEKAAPTLAPSKPVLTSHTRATNRTNQPINTKPIQQQRLIEPSNKHRAPNTTHEPRATSHALKESKPSNNPPQPYQAEGTSDQMKRTQRTITIYSDISIDEQFFCYAT